MTRYVIMGVSGCGKSTVGTGVASVAGLDFVDGDDLHPQANIDKMARGQPLDDADRAPWLVAVGERLTDDTIIACSALKRSYRDLLRAHTGGPVTFLYLRGQRDTLVDRMHNRSGHFMPATLLDSQLATLEEPADGESVIVAEIENKPDEIVALLVAGIRQKETLT